MIVPIISINGEYNFDFNNIQITKDISIDNYRIKVFDKETDGYLKQYLALFKKGEGEWVRLETHLYPNISDFNCFIINKEKNITFSQFTDSVEYKRYFNKYPGDTEPDLILYLLGQFGDKYYLKKDKISSDLITHIEVSMKRIENSNSYQIMRLLGRENIYLEQKELVLKQLRYLSENYYRPVEGKRITDSGN